MIISDLNNNLLYTQGDTLALEYDLGGYELQEGDIAELSIKRKGQIMLVAQIDTVGLSVLKFIISAEDMSKLPVGRYDYDMHIKFAYGGVYTTDFPREFLIVGVAHE